MTEEGLAAPEEIAIVGMAGRFPGARDVEQFWTNLRQGVESVRSFTPEELNQAGVSPETRADPNFVNAGSIADDLDCFDAGFFGISKREAEIMDPQHRVLLETAWEALENAGYDPAAYDGMIGVFGGVAPNTYRYNVLSRRPDLLEKVGDYLSMISTEKEYAITRIAFKLNLRGPSVSVNTACSSSAVALHLACQSLLAGENDLCLVGGARVRVPLTAGYLYLEDGIPSPDGHCRAFDANARGTVIGSGAAFVAIKRLTDAIRDRDTIHAIIKSTAINNDGSAKVGFTAPSVQGQADVIAEAHAMAGVSGDQIQYVEAHGTGTALGDPIEVAALTRAFRRSTDDSGFCAIGSVKTNIGHLDAAAGVTGVIKTALALKHGEIPPSLNFERPNPQIAFDRSPFYVNAELSPWPEVDVRRAGVSSFGLGGTNAHLVLEEPPSQARTAPSRPHQLLVLSARSEEALNGATKRLGAHLARHPEQSLADVAFTLQQGRRRFSHRRIFVTDDPSGTPQILEACDPRRLETRHGGEEDRPVAFLFPGGGTQYVGMGRRLYATEPVFRGGIDRCAEIVRRDLGWDLTTLLFAEDTDEAARSKSERPSFALPLLFSVEYALSNLWRDWGIKPVSMMGHSMGEYTAACVAGVITLEQGLGLVALRGRLFETLPEGGMLSVLLPPSDARRFMSEDLDFAAVNRPDACVASGSVSAIERMQRTLDAEDIPCTRIHIDVAAHSRLVEPILQEFAAHLETMELSEPRIPYVSNVTGTWIKAEEATDPEYWLAHLRQTVRFSDGLRTMFEGDNQILLEVGPGQTLSTFARQHPDRSSGVAVIPSLRHPREEIADDAFLLKSLGRLWMAGADVDWARFTANEERYRVPLPTYPFERTRYWVAIPDESAPAARHAGIAMPPAAASDPQDPHATPAAIPISSESSPLMASSADPPHTSRKERILPQLCAIIEDLTGLPQDQMDAHASFLELGLDSLLLTQANNEFQRTFDVKITFRQLFESAPTLDELADYIDEQLPEEALPASPAAMVPMASPQPTAAPEAGPTVSPTPGPPVAGTAPTEPGTVDWLIQQQIHLMQQQLAVLRGDATAGAALPQASGPARAAAPGATDISGEAQPPASTSAPADPAGTAPEADQQEDETPKGLGPWKPVEKGDDGTLLPQQQEHLDALIERFNAKTAESKRLTQKYRTHLSDPRTVAGFRQQWKELVYPIWSDRSRGSKLWDVDGNEWLDITMGFGVTLFGHSPEFITEAIAEQLTKTMAIGPQTVLVGEVAEMICELTGMERAAFCNTGSEAVLAAIRTARTVTGRDKIATFSNDYHGIFDEVLVRGVKTRHGVRPTPVAPGIPREAVQNVVVLDYGDPASLDVIRAQADELAAVVVEPVQSRNPELQPQEFLRNLRALTDDLDVPLVFDEMITGFRLHPAGAQEYFGVQADIATYGKVIGGGMPIGVVAGKARYLDALDAGHWNFGDDSFPEAGVTWFAGTFVRHPLSMAAAHAALKRLMQEGPRLQEAVNRKTAAFANELNAWFNANQYPIRIVHFSSLFLIEFAGDDAYAPLYWHHLRDLGIHTHERRPNFLTVAHNEEDMANLTQAFKEAAQRLREGRFLPLPREEERPGEEPWEAPATDEQIELFLACQMGHDASCAFNLSYSMHFEGSFQAEAMRRAILQLVARHDALRMTFNETGERLRFLPARKIDVPFLDWLDLSEEETTEKLDELIADELEREYDLIEGPLVRARMARLDRERHYVLFGVHHLASDGFSAGILIRELAALYNANCRNVQPDLPEPMQYTEYAEWQEGERQTTAYAEAQEWWTRHVSEPSFPPPLEIPTDRPRPPRKTFDSAPYITTLPAALCKALKKSGMERGCTMFSTLLGGFALWLHRLTGQDDLIVGIPASGQSMVGSDRLVGHCAHHHPLRSRLEWDTSVAEYLKAIQDSVLDAYDHRNFTEGTLLREIQIPRDPSRMALVNVQFNMDPAPLRAAFHDLESNVFFNGRHYNAPDMTLNLVEDHDGSVVIRCEYNTDLLDAETIIRWLENFKATLDAIVEDTDQSVSTVPVMTPEEYERLIVDFNDNALEYDTSVCLHDLVTAQAERTPEAEAVVTEDDRLSYRKLMLWSNQVAQHLRGTGVGRDSLVGVCLRRSVEMVVAILGIHKAGGAYVPLDPGYPDERINFMLEDSGASVVVTEERLRTRFEMDGISVLSMDGDREEIAAQDDQEPEPLATPSDLAYVIYTSGSTGRPKGVAIEHRSPVALIAWAKSVFGFEETAGVLGSTSICFDLSVFELFLPLSSGGMVVLVQDLPALASSPLAAEVTLVNSVPSVCTEVIHSDGLPSSVQTVCLAGEPLTRTLSDRVYAEPTVTKVYDLYGPSEDTTYSTYVLREPGGAETIGRPIANTQAYLLDERRQPVPGGAKGELYLGGDGLARGYLHRPELTKERFVPSPFRTSDGSRLYRTGDLARLRNDGRLEFLGRIDNQVKVRGFRVELGEIEQTLSTIEGVTEAVVLCREDQPGDRRLVAYVVHENASGTNPEEILPNLRRILPDYMVPSHFVDLEQMPRTPNGKVDRKALPPPDYASLVRTPERVAPRNPTEEHLKAIWHEILQVDDIGVEDDFFALGGHSLLAIRMVARVRDAFDVEITLATAFEAPTIAQLAACISESGGRPEEQEKEVWSF